MSAVSHSFINVLNLFNRLDEMENGVIQNTLLVWKAPGLLDSRNVDAKRDLYLADLI